VFSRSALTIAPASAEARAGLDSVRVDETRRARNALRRPVLARGLEQEHLVQVRVEGGDSK
jgi:hypothetical protein